MTRRGRPGGSRIAENEGGLQGGAHGWLRDRAAAVGRGSGAVGAEHFLKVAILGDGDFDRLADHV